MRASVFDPEGKRPIWLTTLADLSLLLLGFFVLVQATDAPMRGQLADALRAGFGGDTAPLIQPTPTPMALETARVSGFAPNSAELPSDLAPLIGWAMAATRDSRVRLTISGSARSDERQAKLIAYDRARAVAGRLVAAGAVSPDGVEIEAIEPAPGTRAEVNLQIGFGGERQGIAGGRQ